MRHHIRLAAKIAGASAALVIAAGLGWMANAAADSQPDCPTEDSCTIDYREGGWHIEPDIP